MMPHAWLHMPFNPACYIAPFSKVAKALQPVEVNVCLMNAVGGDKAWEVEALPGPNAEPDYFTPEDIATFYSSAYKVHYNS